MRHLPFLICSLISIVVFGQEESEPIIIGEQFTMTSEVLEEDRPILVYTPHDYKDHDEKYPVMYLLDGWGNFHHTTACVKFLAKNNRAPEMIVVGIPNTTDRTRDLTPPTADTSTFSTAGGADRLLQFIETELIPEIDKRYRTKAYKMLVGHSFGGLFAVHTFVHHPDVFDSYLAISPSLWWDDQLLVDQMETYLKGDGKNRKGHIYLTMGSETGPMLGGVRKVAALLEENRAEDFNYQFDHMPDESHSSIPHLSTYKGLEFIFEKWNIENRREAIAEGGFSTLEKYQEEVQNLYGLEPSWDEQMLDRLGQDLILSRKPEEGLAVYELAIAEYPESERIAMHLAESYQKVGNKDESKQAYLQVLEINPENFAARVALKQMGEDVGDLVPEVSLTETEIARYSGHYLMEMGVTIKVDAENGNIFAEADILPREQLYPLGDHRFYVISKESTMIFDVADDKAIKLRVETPDGSFEGVVRK